jgi:hypothetical protein
MDDTAWCELGGVLASPFLKRVATRATVGLMGEDVRGPALRAVFSAMLHGVVSAVALADGLRKTSTFPKGEDTQRGWCGTQDTVASALGAIDALALDADLAGDATARMTAMQAQFKTGAWVAAMRAKVQARATPVRAAALVKAVHWLAAHPSLAPARDRRSAGSSRTRRSSRGSSRGSSKSRHA